METADWNSAGEDSPDTICAKMLHTHTIASEYMLTEETPQSIQILSLNKLKKEAAPKQIPNSRAPADTDFERQPMSML